MLKEFLSISTQATTLEAWRTSYGNHSFPDHNSDLNRTPPTPPDLTESLPRDLYRSINMEGRIAK